MEVMVQVLKVIASVVCVIPKAITGGGAFNIIYRPPSLNSKGNAITPSWEATCPSRYHNVGEKRRKTMSFVADHASEESVALWRVRHWCNMALFAQQSRKHHKGFHPLAADLPEEDSIVLGRLPDGWDGDGEELPDDGEVVWRYY